MDGPYRSAPRERDVEAPRDAGIVDDVVAQFADTFAFYRELVQNAIDAGTPSIEVELGYDESVAAARATVRDRGEGMDRDTIENQLLVLFRSTKDKDPTKIGKFGIGFSSVLAPRPRVVVVQTTRDGARLTLHLHPDLSYQLFDGGTGTRSGTSVELELPMEADAFTDFVEKSRAALTRWCRHAAVPIHLRARRGADAVVDVRIDSALALDGALVEVRGVSADGGTSAVVGLMAEAAPYAGFFNRGLMLHETEAPVAGRIAFKVIDARLGHTLSRDDVRRDAAYEHALEVVRELAGRALTRAAAAELEAAAAGDGVRWRRLFEAIDAAELPLAPHEWEVPLVTPVHEARSIAPAVLPPPIVWAAHRRTPLTVALAEIGVPVVELGAGGCEPERLAPRIERSAGRLLVDVAGALTLIHEVEPKRDDDALLDELGRLLERALRRPPGIVLGTLTGALAGRLCIAAERGDARYRIDDQRWIIALDAADRSPFSRLWRRALVLNRGDALVSSARRRATRDPVGAASLLARAVLLHHGALDGDVSAALLEATLDRLEEQA